MVSVFLVDDHSVFRAGVRAELAAYDVFGSRSHLIAAVVAAGLWLSQRPSAFWEPKNSA